MINKKKKKKGLGLKSNLIYDNQVRIVTRFMLVVKHFYFFVYQIISYDFILFIFKERMSKRERERESREKEWDEPYF